WLYRNSVWFHCAGTSIRYLAPSSGRVPHSTVSPGTIGAGQLAWLDGMAVLVDAVAEAVAAAPASTSADAIAAVNLRGDLSTSRPPSKSIRTKGATFRTIAGYAPQLKPLGFDDAAEEAAGPVILRVRE